jgi:putative transposase
MNASEEIFRFAEKTNAFNRRKLDVAVDFHDIPFWGDESNPMLVRTPKEQGTTFAYRFATISIVEKNCKFTLISIPVSPLDKLKNIVDYLVGYAQSIIPIDTVYLDRGFYTNEVINVLKDHNVKFLMVAVRNQRIKRLIRENSHGTVIDYKMDRGTTFKIVITEKENAKHAFVTNLNLGYKRRFSALYELYGRRWNIETSYRILDHDFKARTTSKRYVVRLFYFLFCVFLYNLWILSNILLISLMLKYIPDKPIITAKYFGKVFVIVDPG